MISRGDSSASRASGPSKHTLESSRKAQVKILLPAPPSSALRRRSHPIAAAGPRWLITTALVVVASVTAIAAAIRISSDAGLRTDLADLFLIPAEQTSPIALAAIGVALFVGVATLAAVRSLRR